MVVRKRKFSRVLRIGLIDNVSEYRKILAVEAVEGIGLKLS